MNDLQIFNNEQFGKIRAVEIEGEPWFCLADICKPLGLQAYKCKGRLKPEGILTRDTPTNSGTQGMLWVNEGNLYRAIFQSKKPEAEAFTDWVTEEVLPALRKHGVYEIPAPTRVALPEGVSLSGLAKLISVTRRIMPDAGSSPYDVCGMVKETFTAVGLPVPSTFPRQLPGQMCLFEHSEEVRV